MGGIPFINSSNASEEVLRRDWHSLLCSENSKLGTYASSMGTADIQFHGHCCGGAIKAIHSSRAALYRILLGPLSG